MTKMVQSWYGPHGFSQPVRALTKTVALAVALSVMVILGGAVDGGQALAQSDDRSVEAEKPVGGNVPGGHLGVSSDAEIWRAVKDGLQGGVTIPNQQSGVMIQTQGQNWRELRNRTVVEVGVWALAGMVALLALFFLLRGRIRIEAGPSGHTMERFNGFERFVHWLTASSFVVLGLTGLNLLYGKFLLLPLIGGSAFGAVMIAGKYAHNFLAFSFMVGIVLMLVIWLRHNIPNKYDLAWALKLGGLFVKGVHPPSRKFNLGQKVIFWLVIVGGGSLSLSGVALLFPFQMALFDGTFVVLNAIGFDLPTGLSAMEEMQYAQIWHALVGLIMIAVIIAHIYIGSIGMEGAFDAMGSGQVDENWAREHHNVWVAETKGEPLPEPFAGNGDHGTQAAE